MPMPVYFLYQTAFAEEDGTVQFRDDIYGRDAQLAAALATMEQGLPEIWTPALSRVVPADAKSCPEIAANLAELRP